MPEILLIDDDESLVELLRTYLTKQGYNVAVAGDGKEGLRVLYDRHPDLVVLDVTMPRRDGWETLERIREVSSVPVVMLSARDAEVDILHGFSLGADNYVTKPFSFAQLAARINAILTRESERTGRDKDVIREGDLTLDMRSRRVWRGDERIALTPTEFNLLSSLMLRVGEVIPPEDLVRQVWGPQYAGEVGHVRRYIWHLRRKIEPDPENPQYLHNERGFGYRFQ
ncbi:MAG: response regulator, partial [Anaerolineales bacterium]|nr:response regulator [Anaerolineales bacterium]